MYINLLHSMKWFNSENIRNKEELSEEQINFIKSRSITIFGPFNVIVRKHWDFLFITLALEILTGFIIGLIFPQVNISASGRFSVSDFFIFYVPTYSWILLIYGYLGIKYGRRLAWNRNQWKSFESFKESEEKWHIWGCLGIGVLVIKIAITLLRLIAPIS